MNVEETMSFWKETIPKEIENIFDLFKDFENFKETISSEINSNQIIKEKPDFISEIAWNNLFIKDYSYFDHNHYCYGGVQIFYLKIEDINVCLVQSSDSYCFVLLSGTLSSSKNASVASITDLYRNKYSFQVNSKMKTLFKEACSFYGEENVKLYNTYLDTTMGYYNIYFSKIALLIRHRDFWVKDMFGIKFLIKEGFTCIQQDGDIILPPRFIDLQTTNLGSEHHFAHPHIPTIGEKYDFIFKDVCTGTGSPFNVAKNSFIDTPNEETAFNYFINYDNLLSQESEEGVPHVRMRKWFLSSRRPSANDISKSDFMQLIKEKNISFSVHISDKIDISISRNSITTYLNSLSEKNTTIFYNTFDNKEYEFKNPSIYENVDITTIVFNGESINVKMEPFDSNRLDISEMKNNHHWKPASKLFINSALIDKTEKELASLFMQLIINELTIKPFTYDKSKELIGLTEVRRNSNVERIFNAQITN